MTTASLGPTSQQPQTAESAPRQPYQVNEGVSKVTRIVLQALAFLAGIICLAIGITITPFSKTAGLSVLTIAAAMFGTAGFFFSKEFGPKRT